MKFIKWNLHKIKDGEWINPVDHMINLGINVSMKFAIGFEEAGLTECYGISMSEDFSLVPLEYNLTVVSKDNFLTAAKIIDKNAYFDELGYFYINQFGHNPDDASL